MIRTLTLMCTLTCLLAASLAYAATATPVPAKRPAPKALPAAAPHPIVCRTYRIRTDRAGAEINWITGQLEVAGIGYALDPSEFAMHQAHATALAVMVREARKFLPTVPADSKSTLAAVLARDDAKGIMNGLLANLTVINEAWDVEHRCYTVVGVLPIYGEYGLTYLGVQALNPRPIEATADEIVTVKPIPRGHTPQRFTPPYTGVIINGEAALLEPCLYPRLLRFDGKELWGPSNLKPAATVFGPIRYAVDVDTALQMKLAGDRPLILHAIGKGQKCNPMLNLDDVYLALSQERFEQLLEQLPIIITISEQ